MVAANACACAAHITPAGAVNGRCTYATITLETIILLLIILWLVGWLIVPSRAA